MLLDPAVKQFLDIANERLVPEWGSGDTYLNS
jgi:hypothetical protein